MSIKAETSPSQNEPSYRTPPSVEYHRAFRRRKALTGIGRVRVKAESHIFQASAAKRSCSSLPKTVPSETELRTSAIGTIPTTPLNPFSCTEKKLSKDRSHSFKDQTQITAKFSHSCLGNPFDNINNATDRMNLRQPLAPQGRSKEHTRTEDWMVDGLLTIASVVSCMTEGNDQEASSRKPAKQAMKQSCRKSGRQPIDDTPSLALYQSLLGKEQVLSRYNGLAITAASTLALKVEIKCQDTRKEGKLECGLGTYNIGNNYQPTSWRVFPADVSRLDNHHISISENLRHVCTNKEFQKKYNHISHGYFILKSNSHAIHPSNLLFTGNVNSSINM